MPWPVLSSMFFKLTTSVQLLCPVAFVVLQRVCFEHGTGDSMVSPDTATVVCCLVGSPMTKEMPCSRFVHPVSGVNFKVYTLQPFRAVQYITVPRAATDVRREIYPTLFLMRAVQFNVNVHTVLL